VLGVAIEPALGQAQSGYVRLAILGTGNEVERHPEKESLFPAPLEADPERQVLFRGSVKRPAEPDADARIAAGDVERH
jgi:hypothetical protein